MWTVHRGDTMENKMVDSCHATRISNLQRKIMHRHTVAVESESSEDLQIQ
jgi:hypothetical protein